MTAKFWIITLFEEVEYLLDSTTMTTYNFDQWSAEEWEAIGVRFAKGQLEACSTSGRLHWQFVVAFRTNKRMTGVKAIFSNSCHVEPTRSGYANEYCWKDKTSMGRRFVYGTLPTKRNDKDDWEMVWDNAVAGDLLLITPSIRVQHYNNLKRIQMDNMRPVGIAKTVKVFWGPTGTGKSHKAWAEAGLDAYPKAPTTKFWDGYQGQENVVIDEFFGQIEISHMLRWLDRYPVTIETKGSGTVLKATKIWITSNINPRDWYPQASAEQQAALRRRLQIVHWPLVRKVSEVVDLTTIEEEDTPCRPTCPISRDLFA